MPQTGVEIPSTGSSGESFELAGIAWVAKTGGDYATIQAAIDSFAGAALSPTSRGLVLVAPGEYAENLIGRAYVDIAGIGCREDVRVTGAAGVLLTLPTGSGICVRNIDFVSTGAVCMNIPAGAGTNQYTFCMCRFRCVITDNNIDLIHVDSGYLDLNDCRCDYVMTGTTGGINSHRCILINGNANYHMHNSCHIEMNVADPAGIFVGVEETAGVVDEVLIKDSEFHLETGNVAFAGTAAAYYAHGAVGGSKRLCNCHIHVENTGGGAGGNGVCVDLIDAGVTITSDHCTLIAEGFNQNIYTLVFATDVFNSVHDTIRCADGYAGPGTVHIVASEADGSLSIGTNANRSRFEADGTLIFEGDATVWDDLRVPNSSIKRLGFTDPDWEQFKNDGAISTGVYALAFDSGADQEVFFTAQIPHGWLEGGIITPHMHWAPSNANAGNVTWKLEYVWQNIDGTYGNTSTVAVTASTTSVSHKHLISDLTPIDGAAKTISSVLICRLYRDVSDGDTYGSDAFFLEFDFHISKNMVGSHQITTK